MYYYDEQNIGFVIKEANTKSVGHEHKGDPTVGKYGKRLGGPPVKAKSERKCGRKRGAIILVEVDMAERKTIVS